MVKHIHQIFGFWDNFESLEDNQCFCENSRSTSTFCSLNGWNYTLWSLDMANKFITEQYPEFQKLWDEFNYPILKCDFIRYLIIYHFGGIYLDLDVKIIRDPNELFIDKQFFSTWFDDPKKLPYNACMGSNSVKNTLFLVIARESQESWYLNIQKPVYHPYEKGTDKKGWSGRFIFQTTGHYMVQRVLKRYGIVPRNDILAVNWSTKTKPAELKRLEKVGKGMMIQGDNPFFEDFNMSLWWNDLKSNKGDMWKW